MGKMVLSLLSSPAGMVRIAKAFSGQASVGWRDITGKWCRIVTLVVQGSSLLSPAPVDLFDLSDLGNLCEDNAVSQHGRATASFVQT